MNFSGHHFFSHDHIYGHGNHLSLFIVIIKILKIVWVTKNRQNQDRFSPSEKKIEVTIVSDIMFICHYCKWLFDFLLNKVYFSILIDSYYYRLGVIPGDSDPTKSLRISATWQPTVLADLVAMRARKIGISHFGQIYRFRRSALAGPCLQNFIIRKLVWNGSTIPLQVAPGEYTYCFAGIKCAARR